MESVVGSGPFLVGRGRERDAFPFPCGLAQGGTGHLGPGTHMDGQRASCAYCVRGRARKRAAGLNGSRREAAGSNPMLAHPGHPGRPGPGRPDMGEGRRGGSRSQPAGQSRASSDAGVRQSGVCSARRCFLGLATLSKRSVGAAVYCVCCVRHIQYYGGFHGGQNKSNRVGSKVLLPADGFITDEMRKLSRVR